MNRYGDVITVVHAALISGYGGQRVRDWAHATRVEVAASVQPVTVTEEGTDRQVVTTDKRVFCAGGLTEVDRVEWHGQQYEVTGVEEHYQGGAFDHCEATMVATTEADS